MTDKSLVVLDKLIDIIYSRKLDTNDENDIYGRNENINDGIDIAVFEIESFKKFLIDMGVISQ